MLQAIKKNISNISGDMDCDGRTSSNVSSISRYSEILYNSRKVPTSIQPNKINNNIKTIVEKPKTNTWDLLEKNVFQSVFISTFYTPNYFYIQNSGNV